MTDEQKKLMAATLSAIKERSQANPVKDAPVKPSQHREQTPERIAVAQKTVEAIKSGRAAEVTKDSFNK